MSTLIQLANINPSYRLFHRLRSCRGLLLFSLAITLSCLSPIARAACQEGCLTSDNTVLGDDALIDPSNGAANTAVGYNALYSNKGGYSNTAVGWRTIYYNTTGNNNTALGYNALNFGGDGEANTAIGSYAFSNSAGDGNTATGNAALEVSSGSNNTGTGFGALNYNAGTQNTAMGYDAMASNTGSNNTATGSQALRSSDSGSENTANGANSLYNNSTGSNNTATGFEALTKNTTGSRNIAIGNGAGNRLTVGNDNIDIGNRGVHDEARTIRLGTTGTQTNTYVAGIYGITVPGGIGVIVDSQGHLGTSTSSARFKQAIKPMANASEAILSLQPVTFRYKHELDPDGIPQFGLVAEQVEKVNPDLVARDDEGKPYTVRYEAVNAMLLNEFLKEHGKVEEQSRQNVEQDRKAQAQEATITELKSTVIQQRQDFQTAIAQQQEEIHALTAQIQKVSDRLEGSEPAPRVVADNQ